MAVSSVPGGQRTGGSRSITSNQQALRIYPSNPTLNSAGRRELRGGDAGTDGTASEFSAKGAGNPWQSRQSPEFRLFHSSVEKPVEIYPQFTP